MSVFQNVKFLVIDPNAHARKIVTTLLGGFGAQLVREAGDALDGFEQFKSFQPDIVIVEYQLEPCSGLDFVRRLRTDMTSVNPYVPVILLTARTDMETVAAARDAGVTEFCAKPVDTKALHDRIFHIIRSPRYFIRSRTFFGPDRRRRTVPVDRDNMKRLADPRNDV